MTLKKLLTKSPHRRLINKVKSYGIKGEILGWIAVFLSNRTQQVTMNGESSEFKKVKHGIPQGSVLGLLLFVMFINDLPEQVNSECYLFADDIKIFREIKGSDDHTTLQNDINTMLDWANKWQLQFHPDKCVSMYINTKTNHIEPYKMHATELKQVKQEKDIEVIVDD